MALPDLWNQATITQVVREATENILGNQERIAQQFMPTEPTRREKIGRQNIKLRAVGRGRGVVADDATPPIFRPELRMTMEAFSLMRLTEMTPVEESLRRQLEINGNDAESQEIRDRAGVDIITRIRAIAVRQENLSDYLAMQAVLSGELLVTVANPPGASDMTEFVIDYEYPDGHVATVSTSFANLATAKPVDVLRAYQQQLKNATGRYGTEFTMSSDVMSYILNADDTRARFTFNATGNFVPTVTQDMLKQLLYEPDNVTFNVTDAGWFAEPAGYNTQLDADKTRWIPKDRLIVQVPSPANDPFAQMYDGLVPVQVDWNRYEYRGPGAQTYEQLLQGNLTMHYRWEARRLPMIHHPERILVAKVVL